MMDCDFGDYDTRTPVNSSSVMKPKSSAAANKRLICTENQNTAKVNMAKKPKTERDNLVKNSITDLVGDVDFDDDDFDWETSLSSVYKTKREGITPAKNDNEDLTRETRTLSSKLCKKAALNNQQRKTEIEKTQETSSSSSSRAFSDRVGLRSVFSLADDESSCSTSSLRSQRETSCLVTPAATSRPRPQPISQRVTQEDSAIELSGKTFSDDLKGDSCLRFQFFFCAVRFIVSCCIRLLHKWKLILDIGVIYFMT